MLKEPKKQSCTTLEQHSLAPQIASPQITAQQLLHATTVFSPSSTLKCEGNSILPSFSSLVHAIGYSASMEHQLHQHLLNQTIHYSGMHTSPFSSGYGSYPATSSPSSLRFPLKAPSSSNVLPMSKRFSPYPCPPAASPILKASQLEKNWECYTIWLIAPKGNG